MTKFDHIQPPGQFKYQDGQVLIKNYYEFTCDNQFILQIQRIKT